MSNTKTKPLSSTQKMKVNSKYTVVWMKIKKIKTSGTYTQTVGDNYIIHDDILAYDQVIPIASILSIKKLH